MDNIHSPAILFDGLYGGSPVQLSPLFDPTGRKLIYYQLPNGEYVPPGEIRPIPASKKPAPPPPKE